MNEQHCNQCENECPVDALRCGRGRRYFGLEAEDSRTGKHHDCKTEDGPIGLLRQCGHILHHNEICGEDALSALNAEEKKELSRMLGILVQDWTLRIPKRQKHTANNHHEDLS